MISGGAGYLIPMAINVVSTPYVLSKLGAEAYGLQVLANVIIGYLIVADMGLDIPITQKIAEYHAKVDTASQSKFLFATIKIYFIIGLSGMSLLLLFTESLVDLVAVPANMLPEAKIVFYLSGFGFLGSIINMWGKAVFNGFHRYDIANAVNVFNNLFGISVGIILIWNGYGIIGFFSARIAGFLISNVMYIVLAGKYISNISWTPIIDPVIWPMLKDKIGYGFLLRLSGMIFSRMDQALISIWVSMKAVTIYSFPMLIATTLSGLIASLTHFTFPMASAMTAASSKAALESFYLRITKFIVAISTMLFVPLLLWGDKVLAFWINTETGEQGQLVMVLLILSYYVNSCLNISLNAFIVGMGELKYFTGYSVTRGLFLFIGFLLLIKPFGINGAGASYVFALLIDSVFVLYTLRRKMHFNVTNIINGAYLKPMTLGIVLGGVMFFFRNFVTSWFSLISIVAIFEILYCILAYSIGILDDSDKKIIRTFLSKR